VVKVAVGPGAFAIIRREMTERPRDAKRIFSYEEAAALLPRVQRLTDRAQEEVRTAGLDAPANGELGLEIQETLAAIVGRWAEQVVALGVEVKGLWLVDFDNGAGFYCWRHPEARLEYFHSYEDGFRGRMRIQ
jgi:hypothetical protein